MGQLDRESWYTIKDSLIYQTWFSRPGSCLLCFLLFFSVLVFTAFALGLLVFLTSLALLVFLTFVGTFKKPFLYGKNFSTFASGLLDFLTFAVTFKKPFCMEKMF